MAFHLPRVPVELCARALRRVRRDPLTNEGVDTMGIQEQLTQAIGAHGMWKARLRSAIDSGSSEFLPTNVRKDNLCDFGKFLYEKMSPIDRKHPRYETVRALHARFHVEAAAILELAMQGRKADAEKRLSDMRGEYVSVSASLTSEMMGWKAETR